MKEAGGKSFEQSSQNIDLSATQTTGAELRALRKEAGLSQQELGSKLNITQSKISDLENNKVTTEKARKLAHNIELYIREGEKRSLDLDLKNDTLSKEVGKRYRTFRNTLGLNAQQVSEIAGVSSTTISNFEQGGHVSLSSLDKLASSLDQMIDSNNMSEVISKTSLKVDFPNKSHSSEALLAQLQIKLKKLTYDSETTAAYEGKDLASVREERKWLGTIAGLPLPEASKAFRLSEGLTQNEFAKEAEVHIRTLTRIETGERKPTLFTANKIITASPVEETGKAAQLYRLKSSGREAMSPEALKIATFGEILRYGRITQGARLEDAEQKLLLSSSTLADVEKNKKKSPNLHNKFINWLGLPEDSATAAYITQKAERPEKLISDTHISEVVDEGMFLIKNDIPEIPVIKLPEGLVNLPHIGEKLKFLRDSREFSRQALANRTKKGEREMFRTNISNYEKGENLPEEYNLTALLNALGYDIHHPVTWHMLDTAEKERKEREHRGKQIFPDPGLRKSS